MLGSKIYLNYAISFTIDNSKSVSVNHTYFLLQLYFIKIECLQFISNFYSCMN